MKASGRPIKTLIHEEISKEKEASKQSPSVIAKLMGLDSLPPPQIAAKQKKESGSHLPQKPYASRKDCSLRMSPSGHQEFKDVFEIKDSSKVEKQNNLPAFKSNSQSKHDDNDVAFIREKFMEAKRLATHEILQNSKGFNDAIEVLDSNKDLFLKYLEEPNSLFSKDLPGLEGFSEASRESHNRVLRSSKGKMYGIDEATAQSAVKTDRCSQTQQDLTSTSRKSTAILFSRPLKEHSGSLSHKLKSRYAGKNSRSPRSTRIVVLKPNLENSQGMSRKVPRPSSHENYLFGFRKQREFQLSGFEELHVEERERNNLFGNVELMRQGTKGSREIAREIREQMKYSVNTSCDKMMVAGFNRNIKDEKSCGLPPPCTCNLGKFETYKRIPGNFHSWNGSTSPSTSCSPESPVSREARKRLSERWKMTTRFQEARLVEKSTSTLGEMLALSDGETRHIPDSGLIHKVTECKMTKGMLETQFYPSDICNRDKQKDEFPKKLPSSSSLPASSVHGASKPRRRQLSNGDTCYMLKDVLNFGVDDSFGGSLNQRRSPSRKSLKPQSYISHHNLCGEENKLPVKEIHVNLEEQRNHIHISDHSEVKPVLSKLMDSNASKSGNLVDCSSVTKSMNAEMPLIANEELLLHSPQKRESSGANQIDKVAEVSF